MNWCSWHGDVGWGKSRMTAILSGCGATPWEVTWCPRKSSWSTPKIHLLGLMTIPWEAKHSKADFRSHRCSLGVLLAISISSIWTYVLEMPRRTWSIKRWKVCAAFHRPKGMPTYSNRSNGVVIAVFGSSAGSTEIWRYARARSSLENMVATCNAEVKSWICGTG